MSKSRLGKANLFPAPAPARSPNPDQTPRPADQHQEQPAPAPEPVPASVGRPRKHIEPWKKVTVLLLSRNVLFLDRLSLDIATRTGASIARAEILRALVEAVEESGLDLTGISTEEELKALLLDRLRG